MQADMAETKQEWIVNKYLVLFHDSNYLNAVISRAIERLRIAKSLAEFGKRKLDQEARRAI